MLQNIFINLDEHGSSRRGAIGSVLAYSDCYVITPEKKVPFVSCVIKKNNVNAIKNILMNNYKDGNLWISVKNSRSNIITCRTHELKILENNDEYCHIVIMERQHVNNSSFYADFAIFTNKDIDIDTIWQDDEVTKKVFDKLYERTSLPMVSSWKRYISKHILSSVKFFSQATVYGDSSKYGFTNCFNICISTATLKLAISSGLKSREISINGCNKKSKEVENVTGIDSYQETFSNVLSEHTKKMFKPRFDPAISSVSKKVNDFFDISMYYNSKIFSYDVQKNVMESCIRTLDHEKNVLISGQTGSGKTILAIGSIVAHAKKTNYSVIVMVPSKLVARWCDGIKSVVPLANVFAVSNLNEFIEASKTVNNPISQRSTWIIMSENTIKMNYEQRPAVLWDEKKNCYVCPHCGKPIMFKQNRSLNGDTADHMHMANEGDFYKKTDKNAYCMNVLDRNTGSATDGCGAILWTAVTKTTKEKTSDISKSGWDFCNKWIKADKLGWIMKSRIKARISEIDKAEKNISTYAPKNWLKNLHKEKKLLNKTVESENTLRAPRRYNIAKYIRKHMNHKFDYLIADEVHELVNDSLQGRAFGTILGCVWKSIFLTGTLSNGYPSGLFYLLFRTQTKKMIRDGYSYSSVKDFEEKYGVKETTSIYVLDGKTQRRTGKKKKTTKTLPGISPTLVADYLMDYMVSVSKEDIKKNLCKYSEIPVGVDMDTDLSNTYNQIINRIVDTTTISTNIVTTSSNSRAATVQALMKANMFLDQPFGIDIVSEKTNKVIELSDSVVRNKEKKLIELAKKKKANGEKILIFCEYTRKLDIVNRLTGLLNDNGVNAVSMSEKVALNSRQKWLSEKAANGIDAVILNPSLVDVGLNLLEYTTIIFYEIGTKVTTVRQASQRSNRINQTHPVTVYFMYYNNTIQENTLGAISQKLTASKAIEGDFSETALQAMTDDTDVLTKLVNSIVNKEKIKIDMNGSDEDITESETVQDDSSNEAVSINDIRKHYDDRKKFFFVKPKNKISLIA